MMMNSGASLASVRSSADDESEFGTHSADSVRENYEVPMAGLSPRPRPPATAILPGGSHHGYPGGSISVNTPRV